MQKTVENIECIMDRVNYIHHASEGDLFPSIDGEALTDATTFAEDFLKRPANLAPYSFEIMMSMLQNMSAEDSDTGELSAVCPDTIAQDAVDRLPDEGFSDQKLNEIYDAVFNLASVLVKKPEQYL